MPLTKMQFGVLTKHSQLAKMKLILSVTVVDKVQVVCQLLTVKLGMAGWPDQAPFIPELNSC